MLSNAAEPGLRLKKGEATTMQLKDGKGFVRMRFEKAAGASVPEVTVASIVEAGTGRQLDGDSLKAEWRPSSNEALTEIDLVVKTVNAALPISSGTAHVQYTLDGKLHDLPIAITTRLAIEERLKRASSTTIQLNVTDLGTGEAFIVFGRLSGVRPPEVRILAPQQDGTLLPVSAFAHEWDKNGRAWDEAQAVTLRVWIKEKLPPFSEASGSIILRWPEGEQPHIPFKVVDSTTRNFALSRAAESVFTHFQEENVVRVGVENKGIARINKIRFVFTPLTDGENKNEIQPEAKEETVALERNQFQTFAIRLPRVQQAGVYQGVLKVTADGSPAQSVAITVRSRGPCVYYGVPFLLFLLTLTIGYGVSLVLAAWIDLGGEQRNSTLLSLHSSRQDLERIVSQLGADAVRLLPRTKLAIDSMLLDIAECLAVAQRKPQVELDAVRQKAGALATGLRHLVRAVTHIQTHRPETAAQVFPKFDALNPTAADYGDRLSQEILNLPARVGGAAEGGAPAAAPPFIVEAEPTQAELIAKRDWMKLLIQMTTWFAVFSTACLTIYVGENDYGTFTDYLQTVLYGLGISTAGAGIISKASSKFTKKA
ncbi:MAG: hypothetical protein JST93_11955 [Acidobacteria bacterium]|nr:hypothetical protein [Acidobacteriota bacterium]